MALPKRVVRKVDENTIYTSKDELIESLAELAGFTVFEVYDETAFQGYAIEAIDEDLRAFMSRGQPMTDEDIAIAEAEDCYVPYTAEDF